MPKMIFVSLPVTDLERATAFYEAIGAARNPQFSDDTASCMVISETIFAMLMTHDKFRQFTPRPVADARASSQVLLCLSADSRSEVDDSSARPRSRAAWPILARRRSSASCTAAASRIRTAICGV